MPGKRAKLHTRRVFLITDQSMNVATQQDLPNRIWSMVVCFLTDDVSPVDAFAA
jgi:hypothetical protein